MSKVQTPFKLSDVQAWHEGVKLYAYGTCRDHRVDRIGFHVGRLGHARPVCAPGFAAMIPPVEMMIEGLQIADACFYYPENRGITESVKLGKERTRRIR